MTWFMTAEGGAVRSTAVVALEPEMKNEGRWVVIAHVSDESYYELIEELPSHAAAAQRVIELVEMADDATDDG